MNAGGTVVRGEVEVVGGELTTLKTRSPSPASSTIENSPPDLDETFEQGVSRNRIGRRLAVVSPAPAAG
jgi:hypothetical protein